MNTENFDDFIKKALGHYGPIGARATLLSVREQVTEHGDFTNVIVEVTVSDRERTMYAEEWRYGGFNNHEKIPVPHGIRTIDADRLVGAEKASQSLPPGFPLDRASCSLSWPLSPLLGAQPHYHFTFEDVTISVGAYEPHLQRG